MKKIVASILCLTLLLMPSAAFAEVGGSNNIHPHDVSGTFDLKIDKTNIENPDISPYATFTGNGGSVTIDYVSGAKALMVSYKIDCLLGLSTFTGTLEI